MSELKKLGDFATIGSGYAFSSDAFSEDGIPIIRMSDLCNGFVDIKHAARVSQTKGLDGFKLNQGDFLIGMSGSLDAYGVVGTDVTIAYLNQRVGRLSIKDPKKAHYGFFAKVLSSDAYRKYVYREGIGAAQLNISSKQIECFEMYVPEYDIQEKIFQILDTIDTAIQQTQAIINKLKQLKQGLLHDLLTRGVDANGELRPCYDDAPHLYKESPLGWIPKEWELSTVGNEFEIQLGKMLDVQKNNGVMKPYVGNKAVQWDRIDLHEVQQVPLSHSDMKRFRLEAGDLLVCEGGEVGRAAIWEAQLDECYYQKAIHRLRPINGFNPRLMLAFLRYWITRDSLSEFISKTSIAHLTQEKLMTVPLPTPPSSEQNHLVTEILAHKHRQEQEEAELKKLTCLKSALMDDLLTGRIRVTSLLQTEASSV